MTSRSARRPFRLAATVAIAVLVAACQTGQTGSQTPGSSAPPGTGAPAGDYPARAITFVVPFAAAGPTDTVTRLIAEPMKAELGVDIVVQNTTGAGGTVAAGQVAQQPADGYTVLMHHIGMSTAPTLYPDLTYDPLTSFEPIGLVTEVPMTIIGRQDFEPTTLQELIDYVGDNLDTVTYANAGRGAASHLCGLLIEDATDLDLTEVSYDGTEPAITDLLGGHVDFMCDQTTNTSEYILSGDVKAYAVTTAQAVASLPNVPTTAAAGFPNIEVGVWHGLYVPAGTPEGVVQRLTQALQAALRNQNVIDRLAELGAAPVPQDQATSAAHRQKLTDQIELWRPILEAAPTPAPASPAGSCPTADIRDGAARAAPSRPTRPP